MSALLRMTGSVTALGSALIALAVGAAPSLTTGAPWLAVPLLAAGVGQALVAVIALRGRTLPSAAVLTALAVPTLVWVGALALAPQQSVGLPLGPMLAETCLALAAAAMLGRQRSAAGEPKALPALLALVGSAAVVAVVATTALAGTEAGQFAVPHGEHGIVIEDHGHH